MSELTRKGSWFMRYFELGVPFLVSSVLVFDLESPHTAPCVGATECPRVAWVVFDDYVNIPDMRNLKSEDSIWPIRKTETNIDRTQRNPNRTISTSTGETTLSYASCHPVILRHNTFLTCTTTKTLCCFSWSRSLLCTSRRSANFQGPMIRV